MQTRGKSSSAVPHPVDTLSPDTCKGIRGVLCDIDDTLTSEGRLTGDAYAALWAARDAGLRVIPVTGRPAGWVDQIARIWPVDGVVGENGGLWFYHRDKKLHRNFAQGADEREYNKRRLKDVQKRILQRVPGAAVASDQPYRELDLAIDFCEDVAPLSEFDIQAIVREFTLMGATCKVSSIHVNGWYGTFDKWVGCGHLVRDLYGEDLTETTEQWVYFGDSANDEPMFQRFEHSIGVANVRDFLPLMDHHPTYICANKGGAGFAEGMQHILNHR